MCFLERLMLTAPGWWPGRYLCSVPKYFILIKRKCKLLESGLQIYLLAQLVCFFFFFFFFFFIILHFSNTMLFLPYLVWKHFLPILCHKQKFSFHLILIDAMVAVFWEGLISCFLNINPLHPFMLIDAGCIYFWIYILSGS